MKHIFAAALVLTLAACAKSYGTKIEPGELATLTVGQTTRADVEDRFGPATSTIITSEGITTLNYNYVPPAKEDAFFVLETVDESDKKQSVSFVFNPDNTLKSDTLVFTPKSAKTPKP